MLPDLIHIIISVFFCSLVIVLHYESLSVLFPIFVKQKKSLLNITSNTPEFPHSSVWCDIKEPKTFCTFTNLCYASRERLFIFTLTNDSIINGITDINHLKTIGLSSVNHHNKFLMKLVMSSEDAEVIKRKRVTIRYGFILWRFKWDNLMHVIHDDLLPLHSTYERICAGNVQKCVSKYKLTFADEGELGPLNEWYRLFSKSEPLLLHTVDEGKIVCFEESKVGLSSDTLWFQYGFGKPQGPIRNSTVSGQHIKRFTRYVLQKFNIPAPTEPKDARLVVFSRTITRRILNEAELVNMIRMTYGVEQLHIESLDMAANTSRNVLRHVVWSRGVVGMHGAAMILSMFLQMGSVVVELFPFGINPQHVSPVKALCEVTNMGLVYSSWENKDETNTIAHPDAAPLHGGIRHLSLAEQAEITSTRHVPAVECCHNPLYLFRMFQDTIVGADFLSVLRDAFNRHRHTVHSDSNPLALWFFPGPINNITCHDLSPGLAVRWAAPLNAKDPTYHIAVVAGSHQLSVSRKTTEIALPHHEAHVWIKSVDQGAESLDSYIQCRREIMEKQINNNDDNDNNNKNRT